MTEATAIKPPDPIDWNNYDDGGSGKTIPPKGEYSLTPVKIELGRTKEGYLQAVVDVRVDDPTQPWHGFVSRFNRFSTKRWSNRNGSSAADYLRGFGVRGPLTSDAEYEAAFIATQNRPFKAGLDWEIYDGASGFELKGYDNFPTDASGKKQSIIERNGQKYFANVRVKYVVSAIPKNAAA